MKTFEDHMSEYILTDDIIAKLVLRDMVEEWREHWQKSNGGVVNILGHTFDLWKDR